MHASASLRIRRLYSAVYVRRRAFAATCTSSATTATPPRASMGSSRLALISKFWGRDCLTHPGTEGVARMPTTLSGHRVKITPTLFLPHDVAEYVVARAIREGKNTAGVIADILGAESRK